MLVLVDDFAYCGRPRCYRSVCLFVCMFVCLSVTFVHFVQTAENIDTIRFAYTIAPRLTDRVNIRLTSISPSQILSQIDPPLLI